jgi:hypothetical protein
MPLLTNGGFEDPAISYGCYNVTNLPGWYVSENVDVCSENGGWPALEGGQSLDLSGCTKSGAYIEQAFPTEPGLRYHVSFWYANNVFTPLSTGRIRVLGSATLVEQELAHGGSSVSAMNYTLFETNFVADSSQTTLRFTHLSTDCEGLVLDAVSVMQDMIRVFVDGQFADGTQVVKRGSATITIYTAFTNGAILYTLDGSVPTLASTLYTGPFTLRQSRTIRAAAYSADFSSQAETCPLALLVLPGLTATTAGGGNVSIQPADGPYFSNSTAIVTATPAPGWTFLQWLGDASGSDSVATVEMTRDKCVQALFGTAVATATVGNGSVRQAQVAPFYPYGSQIRVTGLPAAGSYLAFWGNAASSTTNSLGLFVTSANLSLTAVFQPLSSNQFALALVADGRGSVKAIPRANRYNSGAILQLKALPDAGQDFVGWSGAATGDQNPLTVTMDSNKVVNANFTKRPHLTLAGCPGALNEEGFRLVVDGEFGALYAIEASSNLLDWLSVGTVTNTYGTAQFTDGGATNLQHRFYRGVEE